MDVFFSSKECGNSCFRHVSYLKKKKSFRLAVCVSFVSAFLYAVAAVYATYIGSSFTALAPVIKAPFYLLPLFTVLVMAYGGIPRLKKLPKAWVVLMIISFSVGLIAALVGISKVALGITLPLYYIGDLLKFSSSWVSFLFVSLLAYLVSCFSEEDERGRKLMFLCLALVVFLAIAIICLSSILPYWQKIHIGTSFLIGYALFYPRISSVKRLLVLTLGVAAAIATGKRGGLAIPIISVMATALLVSPRATFQVIFNGRIARGLVTTMTVVIMFFIVAVLATQLADGGATQRFLNTYNSLIQFATEFFNGSKITDQSMNSRFAENENVRTFYSEHPLEVFFGAGFGAETPMYNYTGVVSVSGNMHHVHSGWWVYFLRNGLVGTILLFAYFAVVAGIALLAIMRRVPLGALLLFMVLGDLAGSYKSNIMLDSIEFTMPVVFGIVLAELTLQEKKEKLSRTWSRETSH